WAYDVIKPLPFIGSLVNIGKAIHTIGGKLRDRLKHKFGDVAEWLNNRLGSDYSEKLLEILWKDPHHAEFLFLDALLEDVNSRKNKDLSLLFLFDHMEDVDTERLQWRYRGRNISEVELWFIFLSSLQNVVGVTASRRRLPENIKESITIEELEVTELDTKSCHQLLAERGVTETNLQTQITSVSGGNPFVLHTVCDMNELGELSLDDIENLRADTLEQVRIKTWKRLFNQAKDLSTIIDRAGLLPFFNREIMNIIIPTMKSADWDQILKLSFIQNRGDGTWTLHALAQELVLAEIGNALPKLVSEVANLLEQAATEKDSPTYKGLALSAKALANESEAIIECCNYVQTLHINLRRIEALSMIEIIHPKTEENQTILKWLQARMMGALGRSAEAEQEWREILPRFQKFAKTDPKTYLPYVIWTQQNFATILIISGQFSEAEALLQTNSRLINQIEKMETRPMVGYTNLYYYFLGNNHTSFANLYVLMERFDEAEAVLLKEIQLNREAIGEHQLYVRGLIDLLHNLNVLYLESGRIDEALKGIQEISNLAANPPPIAKNDQFYLQSLAIFYRAVFLLSTEEPQRGSEGLEAVSNYLLNLGKELTGTPIASWLGWYSNFVGICYRRVHKFAEAENVYKKGLELLRTGYETEPRSFARFLAMTLCNLATLNRQIGKLSESEIGYLESIKILQELTDQSPTVFSPALAQVFTNYAILLRQTGKLSQAESMLCEALSIRRKHAKRNPDYYRDRLATSLNNLGVVLSEANKHDEALEVFHETLQLRRNLSEKALILYSKGLASTLTNLGILMKHLGKTPEAEAHYREALKIWKRLAKKDPEAFQPTVAQNLSNLAHLLSETGSSSKSLDLVMNQLKKLGVTSLPKEEVWIENEEDFLRVFLINT
ncbi:MAG: tetratricopeptide repeat protein, partial [Promethearchaeota archaeon]